MVDEDFAWRLAQDLVKIDSSDPGAYEGEIEQHIKGLVEAYIAKLDSPVLDVPLVYRLSARGTAGYLSTDRISAESI